MWELYVTPVAPATDPVEEVAASTIHQDCLASVKLATSVKAEQVRPQKAYAGMRHQVHRQVTTQVTYAHVKAHRSSEAICRAFGHAEACGGCQRRH